METSCGGVFLNVGKERAVAATKSFTSQIVVLIMMAVWFSANRADQLPEQEDTFKRVR
jgi:glucosamine 6-phosphate synthetase-like amidotransferase/phosphosugar isomerase protein